MTDNTSKLLESLSTSSKSSDEDKYRKHERQNRTKTVEALKEIKKHRKDRKGKHKRFSSSSKSSMRVSSSPNSSKDSLLSILTWLELEQKVRDGMVTKQKLLVLQTVKNPTRAVDYRTYRLANRSAKYDDTVSSRISKLVKKVKSQMEAQFFNPKENISIIGFLATFKLA